MKTVIGLMNTKQEAQSAIQDLLNSGFDRSSINFMARDTERNEFMSGTQGQDYTALPLGSGALTGMGVLEEDAHYYAEGVNRGGLLVTVAADDDRAEKAADILRRNGAVDIDERVKAWRQEGWKYQAKEGLPKTAGTMEREGIIPIAQEELKIGKRQIQTGAVRVYSHIVSTPVEQQVHLREEHAKVERRPVDRPASDVERGAFQERSFEIRETAEEPVISKQARVKEEVIIKTEASERTEQVRDTVRRTEVEVEKMGERKQVSEMDDAEFETHFKATYGQRGERFDEPYRSAYLFAESESSSHPQFRGKQWLEVEEDIHKDWEKTHPGTWSKVQEAIHFGWDRTRRH